MNDPRERIQQEAKASWLQSDRKNTIVVPTRSGINLQISESLVIFTP